VFGSEDDWMTRVVAAPLVLAVACVLGGCASSLPPVRPALVASNASLEAARSAGAPEYAVAEFEQARSKLERARALAQAGADAPALRLAQQAEADAQLARALAASQRSQLALREIENSLRTLAEDVQRTPSTTPALTFPVRP
jgi:phage-related minor tail protein